MRESVQYTIRKRGAWSRVRNTHKIQLKDELATARKSSHSLSSWNITRDTVRRSLSLAKPSMVVRKGSGPRIHALPTFLFEHLSTGQVSTHPHGSPTHTLAQSVLSYTCGLVATACVSSPRDLAVSRGSHMQHNVLTSRVLGVRPEVTKFVDHCRFECCVLCARVNARLTPRWTTCEEDENTLDFFL